MTTWRYVHPVEQTEWHVGSDSTTTFNWNYDGTRDRLLALYEKGKEKQWNTNTRLDWSIDVDPGSPENAPDMYIPIFGSDMSGAHGREGAARGSPPHGRVAELAVPPRRTGRAGLHREDRPGVPDIDSKFYAATQVMDEARHMETYSRYLREKVELAYPINPNLKSLLDDIVATPAGT